MTTGRQPLRFFSFVRAQGGLANDGDELCVSVRCDAPSTLQDALRREVGSRATGGFHAGVLTITLAGGDGDPYSVGEADYALARQIETVLERHHAQVLVPTHDRSYNLQLMEWRGEWPPPPSAPAPGPATGPSAPVLPAPRTPAPGPATGPSAPVLPAESVPPPRIREPPPQAHSHMPPPEPVSPARERPPVPPAPVRRYVPPSQPISHHNLLEFLAEQPVNTSGPAGYTDGKREPPAHWELLGSLHDDALGATTVLHRDGSAIAVGFYPYNGCNIYRDSTTGDILLSYLEVGGHAPFRSTYRITKDSPFLFEPVSCDVMVAPERLQELYAAMRVRGLTEEDIRAQVKHYERMYNITEPLPPDRITFVRAFELAAPKRHGFVIVADRKSATELLRLFHTP